MSLKEIAEAEGVSKGTVQVTIDQIRWMVAKKERT